MSSGGTSTGDSGSTATPLDLSWATLPPVDDDRRQALIEAGREANRAYTEDFVEKYFLCPFAREGRRRRETRCEVIWLSEQSERVVLEPLLAALDDAAIVVLQVVFAGLKVDPEAWIELCGRISQRAHHLRGVSPTFAVAALHPSLTFRTETPYALIPLFRRAPDPTLQWVRLSTLEELHRGREKGSSFVDPVHLIALLTEARVAPSLYDKVAQTNQETVMRWGVERMTAELSRIHDDAQRRYAAILGSSDAPPTGTRSPDARSADP